MADRDWKKYYEEHKEGYKERTERWKNKDPEHFKFLSQQRTEQWRKRNPEHSSEFYWKNKEHESERVAKFNWNLKRKALTILGGICVASNCGIKDVRILQVNHKNGGGNKERLFGDKMYRGIITGTRKTNDLEVRCANHNLLYEYERGARKTPKGVELECGT